MLFCFFFFKQKTAYEMRISDWSSDVCSSDLKLAVALLGRPGGVGRLHGSESLDRGIDAATEGANLFPIDVRRAGGQPDHKRQGAADLCRATGDHGGTSRSEERRGGEEWVSTCSCRWSPDHEKTKKKKK